MRPLFLGIIASSYKPVGGVTGYPNFLANACNVTAYITKYTATPVYAVLVGDTLYNDINLTSPFANGNFAYGSPISSFGTNSSGVVDSVQLCYNTYTYTSDCDGNSPTSVFTYFSEPFGNGVVLYSDASLLTPLPNITNGVLGSEIFNTDGNGIINITGLCSTSHNVYQDCTVTSQYILYTVYNGTIDPGNIVYTNDTLTTPYANITYVYSGTRYTTDGAGQISIAATQCPPYVTNVYTSCDKNVEQIALRSTSPIAVGVTVYSDDTLTTVYAGQTFYYGTPVYQYTTNGGGGIDTSTPCYREWSGLYSTCDDYRDNINPVGSYYTYYADSSIQVGVAVYTDTSLSVPASNFVRAGYFYTLDASGVITSITPCVYSLSYSINGCGQPDNNTFYTTSIATTLADLYNSGINSATLFSDSGLSSPLIITTIFRSSETVYITTDGSGTVNGIFSCGT